jgi:GntP family gluconate:H+ symporter
MDTLIPFAIALVVITVASLRYRLPPFFTLVGTSVLFGLLVGMPTEALMPAITEGAGRIFSILGIVIFCGVGIAQVLRESGLIAEIVAGIRELVRRPLATAGVAGYLLSVPLMCGITSFVILAPIITHLRRDRQTSRTLLYCAGVAGTISFVLLYPAPVVYSTITTLGLFPDQPWEIDLVALPVSLLILVGFLLVLRARTPMETLPAEPAPETRTPGRRLHAWLPFIVIVLMLMIGSLVPPLHALANMNLALLVGFSVALAIVPDDVRQKAVSRGTKNAGIIILDLAGAGAFGGVIAASTFPADVTALVQGFLPITLLPFVIAALLQAAQGSRVVTAAVTSTVLVTIPAVAAINPLALVLMVSAGAFMFSYVSDPFFWVLKRMTGDEFSGVVRNYTLPLLAAGLITLTVALVVDLVL